MPAVHTIQGSYIFAEDEPFRLEGGGTLQPVTVRFAIYGEPNEARDNVVLVCHALSGSSRVTDWWPELVGTGRVLDPEHDCIVCTNVLGSCYGSTGPRSIDQRSRAPYNASFPVVSVRDIIRAQARFLDWLGITRLRAVIGGSIGGMQALQWAVDYPERVQDAIAIGVAPLSAMGLALNHLQRQAIFNDPRFNGGEYSESDPPSQGLALARAIAMCSYKSAHLFTHRFHRGPNRNGEDPFTGVLDRYDVAGYLDHQGEKFVRRFDANSYIAITKSMDNFDLSRGYTSDAEAFSRIEARVSLVGISSDWLFPTGDIKALTHRMKSSGVDAHYHELQSHHGHDGFLADFHLLAPILRRVIHGDESYRPTLQRQVAVVSESNGTLA
jgi:homoserine O-acetyltransferase